MIVVLVLVMFTNSEAKQEREGGEGGGRGVILSFRNAILAAK